MHGDRAGAVVPRRETTIDIVSEHLTFDLTQGLGRARVSAAYRMANRSDDAQVVPVAFVIEGNRTQDMAPAVTFAGRAVTFERVPLGTLFAADVRTYLLQRENAALEPILNRAADQVAQRVALDLTDLKGALEQRGTVPDEVGMRSFVLLWQAFRRGQPADPLDVLAVARMLFPAAVARVEDEWRQGATTYLDPVDGTPYDATPFIGGNGPLQFLMFTVAFDPKSEADLVVSYTHGAAFDRARRVNDIFHYEYLLRPARSWGSFGTLTVTVLSPEDLYVASNLALQRLPGQSDDLVRFGGSVPELPEENLSLSVMSRRGILWGETESTGIYYRLVVITALLTAIATGLLGGWASSSLKSTFGAVMAAWWAVGTVALVPNSAAVALMFGWISVDALKRDYPVLVGAFIVLVAQTLTILVSIGCALFLRARRRRSARARKA